MLQTQTLQSSYTSVSLSVPRCVRSLDSLMLHIAFDQVLNKFVSDASFLECAIDDAQDYSVYCPRGKECYFQNGVCIWRGGRRSKFFYFFPLCSNKSIYVMLAVMLAMQARMSLCQQRQNSEMDCKPGSHLCSSLSSELK